MKKLIRLHPSDNVAIALTELAKGETVDFEEQQLTVSKNIGLGHKIAVCDIRSGEKVRRNNVQIGSSTQDIKAGDHVHLHNLKSDYIPTLNKHYQNREVQS